MNDNPIGDTGITAIVKSLIEKTKSADDDDDEDENDEDLTSRPSRMKVTHLNLNNCQIGNKGIIEVRSLYLNVTDVSCQRSILLVQLYYYCSELSEAL